MSWFGLGLVISCLCPYLVRCDTLPGIYWNRTSPRFHIDSTDHIVNVNLNDDIDIFCPYYPGSTKVAPGDMEYYVIYQVPERAYRECNIRDVTKLKVLNCSVPNTKNRATILFTQYSAIPYTPEFKPGESYYIISTSTGSKWGMDNPMHGACNKHNMKIKFNVCCSPGTESWCKNTHCTPTTVPTSTPTKPTTTTPPPEPTKPTKPVKPTKRPGKDDKYSENEAKPKDERRVGDSSSIMTSSHGLVVCALVVIRLLAWLHCR